MKKLSIVLFVVMLMTTSLFTSSVNAEGEPLSFTIVTANNPPKRVPGEKVFFRGVISAEYPGYVSRTHIVIPNDSLLLERVGWKFKEDVMASALIARDARSTSPAGADCVVSFEGLLFDKYPIAYEKTGSCFATCLDVWARLMRKAVAYKEGVSFGFRKEGDEQSQDFTKAYLSLRE